MPKACVASDSPKNRSESVEIVGRDLALVQMVPAAVAGAIPRDLVPPGRQAADMFPGLLDGGDPSVELGVAQGGE